MDKQQADKLARKVNNTPGYQTNGGYRGWGKSSFVLRILNTLTGVSYEIDDPKLWESQSNDKSRKGE